MVPKHIFIYEGERSTDGTNCLYLPVPVAEALLRVTAGYLDSLQNPESLIRKCLPIRRLQRDWRQTELGLANLKINDIKTSQEKRLQALLQRAKTNFWAAYQGLLELELELAKLEQDSLSRREKTRLAKLDCYLAIALQECYLELALRYLEEAPSLNECAFS